ncbi:hypothetical protein HBB16_06320 [Pseudonocardia sp. MCCB 268]|nr:hypothetical protein [Pseudonocardia cytotoxica]
MGAVTQAEEVTRFTPSGSKLQRAGAPGRQTGGRAARRVAGWVSNPGERSSRRTRMSGLATSTLPSSPRACIMSSAGRPLPSTQRRRRVFWPDPPPKACVTCSHPAGVRILRGRQRGAGGEPADQLRGGKPQLARALSSLLGYPADRYPETSKSY